MIHSSFSNKYGIFESISVFLETVFDTSFPDDYSKYEPS